MGSLDEPAPDQPRGDLLDLLEALARSFWLLLLGPLIAGVAAYTLSDRMQVKTYTSTAYLSLQDAEAQAAEAVIRSPAVIDAVLKSEKEALGSEPAKGPPPRNLSSSIRFGTAQNRSRKTATIFTVSVTDTDPDRAYRRVNGLIENWLRVAPPLPTQLERFDALVQSGADQLQAAIAATERVKTAAAKPVSGPTDVEQFAGRLDAQIADLDRLTAVFQRLQALVKTFDRDVVFSPPTRPAGPDRKSSAVTAILAALAVAFLLVCFVVARQAYKLASETTRLRVGRIADAILFRRRAQG